MMVARVQLTAGGMILPVDGPPVIPTKPKARRFHGTVDLDLSRPIPNAGQIVESVIQHLQSGNGAMVSVSIEIVAEIPEGADEKTVRTVSENCRVLKFTDFGFEER